MYLNETHVAYMKRCPVNSLVKLFVLIDRLDPKIRDRAMFMTFVEFIDPQSRPPVSRRETMADLLEEAVNYPTFKRKLAEMSEVGVQEWVVVHATVSRTLGYLFSKADTDLDEMIAQIQKQAERFRRMMVGITDEHRRSEIQGLAELFESKVATAEEDQRQARSDYDEFCDRVVLGLLGEDAQRSKQMGREILSSMIDDLPDEEFPGAPKEPGAEPEDG